MTEDLLTEKRTIAEILTRELTRPIPTTKMFPMLKDLPTMVDTVNIQPMPRHVRLRMRLDPGPHMRPDLRMPKHVPETTFEMSNRS